MKIFTRIKVFFARLKLAWLLSGDQKALDVGATLKKIQENETQLEEKRQALVAKAHRVIAGLLPEDRHVCKGEDKSRLEVHIESAGIMTDREADAVLAASRTKHTIPRGSGKRAKLALAIYNDQLDEKRKIQ